LAKEVQYAPRLSNSGKATESTRLDILKETFKAGKKRSGVLSSYTQTKPELARGKFGAQGEKRIGCGRAGAKFEGRLIKERK